MCRTGGSLHVTHVNVGAQTRAGPVRRLHYTARIREGFILRLDGLLRLGGPLGPGRGQQKCLRLTFWDEEAGRLGRFNALRCALQPTI